MALKRDWKPALGVWPSAARRADLECAVDGARSGDGNADDAVEMSSNSGS